MKIDLPIVGESSCSCGQGVAYERVLVATPSADMDKRVDEFYDWLWDFQDRYFDGPFGYISNRVHRNAGYPKYFRKAGKEMPNWETYALVAYSAYSAKLFEAERKCLGDRENRVFFDLKSAILWSDERIREILQARGVG